MGHRYKECCPSQVEPTLTDSHFDFVIHATAGIKVTYRAFSCSRYLDSRLRGNDGQVFAKMGEL